MPLLGPCRQMQMQPLCCVPSALITEFLLLSVRFLDIFSLLGFKFVFKQINEVVLSLAEHSG